ncbi:rhodanese-like domain-containing protein [Natronosalvus vescus]|uniref:rhodanese-like domain-containing protein n=1 Tax=Natronosalvus vescus TaxID=2953881 RepID=UPI002090DD7D|nr:rhodanese-like domain-containing protein [Natronosalvus vescus]
MNTIRPDELDDRLESGEQLFVLDIRPRRLHRANAIAGSYNLPVYDELRKGDKAAFRDRLEEIPTDRDVVVVCKMGVVARRATGILETEGYEAATLAGGMSGWSGYQKGSLRYKLWSMFW